MDNVRRDTQNKKGDVNEMTSEKLRGEQVADWCSDTLTWDDAVNWVQERRYLETLYWAGVLIWAGLVFMADSLALLPQIGEADAWSWLFFGAGLYGTLANLYRLASANWSNPTDWDYVWSGFWLVLGLSGVTSADVFWPLALVLVGVIALAHSLLRRD